MARSAHVQALDDLCYVIECAAMDYMGEGKRELSALCDQLESEAGYASVSGSADIAAVLRDALESFRVGDKHRGASILSQVSRKMWASLVDA